MAPPIETRLKAEAARHGFAPVGIARATEADGFDRYRDWLDRGYAGEMGYLHEHLEQRRHPDSVLENVRSVMMVGLAYGGRDDHSPRVAKYAQAPDYHRVIWDKLNEMSAWLEEQLPGTQAHGVADSAPLLERDFARRAGLGWFGKNTMLLDKKAGSFFLLGALLTTAELRPDEPHVASHCGTCTACLDACPTQAFVGPGWLDARKCISYLTVELKSPIPEELRPGVGDWLFGCDVCQDVCPWNHHTSPTPTLPHRPDLATIDPCELLALSPTELRQRFKETALVRANWRGLLRNAAIVLGNRGDVATLPALHAALLWEDDLVREACEWAIARITSVKEPRTESPTATRSATE